LRFKFDRQEMIDRDISMIDIYHAINIKFNKDTDDIVCVFSDDNAEELILRIQCVVSKDEKVDTDESDMINLLKTLEDSILNDLVLKGTKDIEKATMSKENRYLVKEGNDYHSSEQWIIEAIGDNYIDILNNPYVCFEKTVSNNINEIYNILGVEAARQVIIQEITELLEQSAAYINYRHISLLADTMTNRGSIMPIDRHGIKKSERGPLAKCSFEETPDILTKAAVFGELDRVKGVSANIMLGQEVNAGTAYSNILFDEEMFIENMMDISKEKEEVANIDNIIEKMDDYCDESNFGFNFE